MLESKQGREGEGFEPWQVDVYLDGEMEILPRSLGHGLLRIRCPKKNNYRNRYCFLLTFVRAYANLLQSLHLQ